MKFSDNNNDDNIDNNTLGRIIVPRENPLFTEDKILMENVLLKKYQKWENKGTIIIATHR